MTENISDSYPAHSAGVGKTETRIARLRSAVSRPALMAWLAALTLVAAFIAFLSLVQFNTEDIAGVDGYYHIRFASIMRSQGLKPDFPWLPLTILNPREFYDHHFLYHVGLIPFTLGDIHMGAKWSAVLFATLAFLSIWWLLRSQRVPYSILWSLGLLAISEAFIYRMSMVRAQSLSLAVMILGLHWMLARKYSRLIPLAFFYVWLYDAFPMLLVISIIYVGALWVIERQLDLRPILYTGLGLSLGLLINPYFPDNIVFVYRHLLPKLTATTAVDVGSEWYPYQTSQLLENSPLSLVAFFSGVIAIGLQERRMDTRTAASLFIAILFGLMLFQSRRFIEYFPPFALIFAAIAWSPLIKKDVHQPAKPEGDLDRPQGFFKLLRSLIEPTRLQPAVLLVILIPGIFITYQASRLSMRASNPYTQFAGASAWLKENTPEGSRVFQTDWDDFPRLFYYNTHNTYLIGLDPTYMQIYNQGLYALWVDVTRGKVENPSGVIYDRFGASYVVTDLTHLAFLRQAKADPGLKEVYRDSNAAVFQLTSP